MPINTHQLRVFQAVAEHLSYSRAAEDLGISQPAVSMQVKALQNRLGLALFEQQGKTVYLTAAGQELYHYSQRILALMDETVQVMEEYRGVRRGVLAVAASTTAGIYVVPPLLGQFHRLHPEIQIALEVANRFTVQERLVQHEVDLAVMGLIEDTHELEVEEFLPNELVVIASPRHRLAGRGHIPLVELGRETFLVREPKSGTRADMKRFFEAAGLAIQVGMELGSIGAIKRAVAADLGIAVLPKPAIPLELATSTLVVLDVEGFPIRRNWHLVHLRGKHLPPAAREFKSYLHTYHREGHSADELWIGGGLAPDSPPTAGG